MRQRVALPLLAAVICGLLLTHIQVITTENGPLLSIDGRKVDLVGEIKNQWVAQTRSCKSVSVLSVVEARYGQAKNLIESYSPPSSQSARIAGAWSMGSWVLIEVEFEALLPAVVALKATNGDLKIVPNAIWSGYTTPWVAEPLIRDYLSRQAPDMPSVLLDCFTPRSKSFQ